ncbi:MAG: endo-1,4-beta-xylanase, partial [Cyanobacteria bacterium P01_F01_bin.4]
MSRLSLNIVRFGLIFLLATLVCWRLPRVAYSQSSIPALQILATPHRIGLGTAVSFQALQADRRYRETLGRKFGQITPENAIKFEAVHPAPDRYDFYRADTLLAFAEHQGMTVHGHTLVWHSQLPEWVKIEDRSREVAIALLREHIQTVVRHYRGRLVAWDVVNEAIADDGTFRDTIWLRQIGPDYIAMAFRWAHGADPSARLFYNDYGGEGLGPKSDAIYRLVADLVEQGVPIQGVGLQMHVSLDSAPSPSAVAANMQRLAALGLEAQVTEMDVRLALPDSEADRQEQAAVFR